MTSASKQRNLLPAMRTAKSRFVQELISGLSHFEFASKWAAARRLKMHWRDPEWILSEASHRRWRAKASQRYLSRGSWPEVLSVARQLSAMDRAVTAIDILLPHDKCLLLRKVLPPDRSSKALPMLRYELERVTPFQWDEVFADYFMTLDKDGQGDLSSHANLFLIKKSLLAPLIADIEGAGLRLSSVRVVDEHDMQLPINLVRHSPYRAPTFIGSLNRIIGLGLSLVCVLWLVSGCIGLWRQSAELDSISTRLAVAQTDAVAIRKAMTEAEVKLATLTQPRLRKIETTSLLEAWETLTASVPASAWLTSIRINGNEMLIDGFAQSASDLIPVLSRVANFSSVEFLAPVTRDSQVGAERFQIRMKLDRKKAAPELQNSNGDAMLP